MLSPDEKIMMKIGQSYIYIFACTKGAKTAKICLRKISFYDLEECSADPMTQRLSLKLRYPEQLESLTFIFSSASSRDVARRLYSRILGFSSQPDVSANGFSFGDMNTKSANTLEDISFNDSNDHKHFIDVEFLQEGSIGLVICPIESEAHGAILDRVDPQGLCAKKYKNLKAGAKLLTLNEIPCNVLSYEEIVDFLRRGSRPSKMKFEM